MLTQTSERVKMFVYCVGADFVQIGRSHSTYKALTEHLAHWNGTADKVSFRYLQLDQRPLPQFMWDVVVWDVVSPQGVLVSGGLDELAFLRFVSLEDNAYSVVLVGLTTFGFNWPKSA